MAHAQVQEAGLEQVPDPLVVDDWSFATIYNGSRVRLSHNRVRACTCKKHHPRAF